MGIEKDPNNLKPSDAGAKLDANKLDLSLLLLFHNALKAVAEVADMGQKKYTRGGFLEVDNGVQRYTAAMLRHLFTDEDKDNESGLLHDAHLAWNALARLELRLRRNYEL